MLRVVTLAAGASAAVVVPTWTSQQCNSSLPMGGFAPIPGAMHTQVFHSVNETVPGVYNHAVMMGWQPEALPYGRMLLTWKNGPQREDQPGQLIMYSQSDDPGEGEWTPADGSSIIFPNVSTDAVPAALFAEPPVHVNGRMYAAASYKQFCLWPLNLTAAYAPSAANDTSLLMRRVYEDRPGHFGPIFWAASVIPAGFEVASQLNNITTLAAMDAQTQADLALVMNPARYDDGFMPCVNASVSTKCEACAGGCQDWAEAHLVRMTNERTHFTLPSSGDPRTGSPDVLLYRANGPYLNATTGEYNTLWASTRQTPGGAWSPLVRTNIRNQPSNINAGYLPDGRRFLVINPCEGREPLVIVTSSDGINWGDARTIVSCTQLAPFYPEQNPCKSRLPQSNGDGVQYPQAVVIMDPALPENVQGLYLAYTNNKEDVFVTRVPLSAV